MKTTLTGAYRQNRIEFPIEELRQFSGQWVAFSADGLRIVASATDLLQLADRVAAVHVDMEDVVLEFIDLDDGDVYLGGAELL